MTDALVWLTLFCAGIGGALLGQRLVEWVRR